MCWQLRTRQLMLINHQLLSLVLLQELARELLSCWQKRLASVNQGAAPYMH
jgi:hypothetical protein